MVAIPWALTEAELYGYCHGQGVDLGPVMPAAQFWVTNEVGTYLCIVFEGSVLAYNPAKNKAEWVPAHGLTNNVTWPEERSAIALANYVPCIPDEAARITRLGARQLVSWPDNSSMSEEEEDVWDPEPPTMDTEEQGEESEGGARQTDLEEGVKPNGWRCLRDWEAVMEGLQGLAYDDPQSDYSDGDGCGLPVGACIIASHPESCNPTYAGVTNGPIAPNGGHGSACKCVGVGGPLSRRPMVGPRITGEDTRFTIFHNFARFFYKACRNNDK